MSEDFSDDAHASVPPTLTPAASLAHTPSLPHTVLFGPLGLRAGWGILLFFVAFGLLFSGFLSSYTHFTKAGRDAQGQYQAELHAREAAERANPSKPPEPWPVHAEKRIWYEAAQASILLLTTFGMARLERRRFGVCGLGHFRVHHLIGGALTGVLALSTLVGMLRALHVLVFEQQLVSGMAALRSGLLWLLFFAVVGLFEEFFFRGYIQYTLMRGLLRLALRVAPLQPVRAAFWLAAGLWSVLFLLTHAGNAGENPAGLAGVFVAGLVFSYALWRTGSLWWGVGFHMAWDWAESFLFGVPDSGILSAGRLFATHTAGNPLLSGGSAGPEGSLLVLPVFLLVIAALRLTVGPAQASWEGLSFLPEGSRRPALAVE